MAPKRKAKAASAAPTSASKKAKAEAVDVDPSPAKTSGKVSARGGLHLRPATRARLRAA